MAQQVKNLTAVQEMQETGSIPGSGRTLVREDHLRRKWQRTPVFLPGKSHGQRSLMGYKGSQAIRHG